MSRDQVFTVTILVCLIGLFLWDRWRYDLVALLALLAAVASGGVPSDKAFNSFANPVLPLIGAALIVSVANTLVMGLWGYHFGAYWKLGVPLSLMVVVLGVPLIMLFWPLH